MGNSCIKWHLLANNGGQLIIKNINMKQLLFLLLFPCLALAQYTGNAGQKITLGEQTTADGLVYRGVASIDTVTATSKITRANKQDTSAFLLLDTVTNLLWHYKTASNGWIQAGGGVSVSSFSAGTTGLTPSTATTGAVTLGGTLAVANGGTGSATQNFVDLTTAQTVNGLKTFGNNLTLKPSSGFTIMTQESPNVSHGVTGWLPNNAYSSATIEDTNNGGFSFVGATDAATPGALNFYGIMGTTSPTSNAINFRVAKKNGTTIQALASAENAMIFNNYGSTDLLQFKGNGDAAFGRFIGGGTTGLSIDNTGTLVRTSSYELKKDITPMHYGLNEILQLNPINFNWVNSDKYGDNNENGFIAEDVMSIIPNSVSADSESVFMDYSKLIPILTKAIQEQQSLIKALEQRILTLENK